MDVLDEEIYKCLDQLDTLLTQDLSLVSQWKQDEENDEKKNSVQVLNCVFRLLDTNEHLKSNSGLLFILKCIFQKHKRLFENLNYEQEPFESADDLPVEAYSLRKYWRQIYPQLRSRILVENLMQNDLSDLGKQFRFSEILEFFLLVERTNFWQFYQQIRKERLMVLSNSCADLKALVEQLVRTIDYEIYLVTNFRYVQNLVVEFSDYILPYSNLIKAAAIKQFDSIGSQSNATKVATLLSAISELNRLEEVVKSKSKLWTKLDLPNSVNLKKLQWDYKEHLIKKDYFNFLLNELNKELNAVTGGDTGGDQAETSTLLGNSKLLSSFVRIVQVLDRYSLIYVKQLKKAFTVIIEVNINQFIQTKFGRLLKRAQLNQLYLYLNTLYYLKENFANYGIDSNKVNELISAQECEFKAKHLFVLGLNAGHMEYYVCYLSTVRTNLLTEVNFNLFQAQKLYQDLLQEALLQLEERELSNDDLVLFLSNLPDLLMFAYDNEGLFLLDSSANSSHRSPFQKIVNKFCWKLLFRVGLLNAPIKCLHSELSKIDDKLLEIYDGKQNWLQYFNPTLYSNLPYYHALVCNQKSARHFIFVCRPFAECRFRLTSDLLRQLTKSESFSKPSKEYRRNRNRLLKALFNLATTSSTQLASLSSVVLPLIQGQTLNFDSVQFELLLDDALYSKHSTNLNQLDWIFGLVKLVKPLVSDQLEIVLNSFLYKHTDLMSIIELDPSIQNLFAKLNLKFLISEGYLLDELTESILELVCDSVLLLPNGLLYSLEMIAKDLKSNDGLIFGSLTAHIILFAVCKQLKSRLKVLLNRDSYSVVHSKIVGNLLSWLTFPEDHDLNKCRNKFNDLVLRRMMNLSLDFVQADESQELESLFRLVEINFENYSNDIDLLENFLQANDGYLNAKMTGQEFKGELNLSGSRANPETEIRITEIYRRSKQNCDQSQRLLRASFDYERLLRLVRTKANKAFIRTYLAKRSDFSSTAGSDDQHVSDLKKAFQIA